MPSRTSPLKVTRTFAVTTLLLCTSAAHTARAQEATEPRDSLERKHSQPAADAAASDGAFLPFSASARHADRKATGKLLSGYDSGSDSGMVKAEAEANVANRLGPLGPLGLRAGVSYDGIGRKSRPFVGGYLDVLEQKKYGLNLSLLGRFESNGFNAVPGVAAGFAVSRDFDGSLLLASAEYGHGLNDNEQNAAGSLAFMQRLSQHFRLGVDGKFQIDLERDQSEPLDEPDWRTVGGPLLVASMGSFSATLGGGVSALRYRLSETNHVGAAAYAGIGAAF
jgi:hypothetical protein